MSIQHEETVVAPFSAGQGRARVAVPPAACDCHVHVYDARCPAVPGARLTPPDASVAVDGTPVPVAADGRFDAAVSAGLWPRDVQIEATDPLGNRNTATVSVVALLDYRQLPWIPIVALLTILAGLVLYLRVPHLRPAAPSGPMTDATLEDLE